MNDKIKSLNAKEHFSKHGDDYEALVSFVHERFAGQPLVVVVGMLELAKEHVVKRGSDDGA